MKWFSILGGAFPFYHAFKPNEFRSQCRRFSRSEVKENEHDGDELVDSAKCEECAEKA